MKNLYQELESYYFSDENLSKLAYSYWENEGKPNGEDVGRFGMKNKDRHWLMARTIASFLLDNDYYFLKCCEIAKSRGAS